jgi:hypothetical protein
MKLRAGACLGAVKEMAQRRRKTLKYPMRQLPIAAKDMRMRGVQPSRTPAPNTGDPFLIDSDRVATGLAVIRLPIRIHDLI